jgi:amyloid beta precursor protein binding protein 1
VQGEYINVFWILCAALREFIDRNQQMPISGQLPDMASDSKRYVQLLSIYRFSLYDQEEIEIIL